MPWKHGIQVLKPGKAWTDSENRMHPKTWMKYSDASKKRYGIIWEDDPATQPFDSRFYHGRQLDGTLIPKSLTDVNEVDDDGNPVNDIDGNQIITPGLKTVWVAQTKRTANDKLSVHDWYVTRKAETDTAIPSDISKYRTDVRTATATIETKINNCSKLSEFIALFDVPVDSDGRPTGNAPIYDFPEEV